MLNEPNPPAKPQAAHSKIGASSMARWSVCPGSVRLSEGAPPKTSIYAEEGTKAHELAAEVLLTGWPKYEIETDLADAVSVYVDYVQSLLKNPQTEMLVEHRFDLSTLYPGLFGTADCVVYQRLTKTLHVIDYKHGAGLPVEVADNLQLKYYSLGALLTSGFAAKTVELVIVQPRCPHPDGPIRSFKMDAVELIDFSADLIKFAKATEDGNAILRPGSHCRFCPASGYCPALADRATLEAKEQFSPIIPYEPEKLAQALEWLPVLEDWIKGVREFAYSEAQHGRIPPGFKMVEKRATRKWIDEEKVPNILWNQYGMKESDMYEDPKLKTPAKIEKLLGKSIDKESFQDLIIQQSSGQTLVHDSDPRSVSKPVALTEFSVIEET